MVANPRESSSVHMPHRPTHLLFTDAKMLVIILGSDEIRCRTTPV